jgi:hypothetical protein
MYRSSQALLLGLLLGFGPVADLGLGARPGLAQSQGKIEIEQKTTADELKPIQHGEIISSLYQTGIELFNSGQHQESLTLFQKMLDLARLDHAVLLELDSAKFVLRCQV